MPEVSKPWSQQPELGDAPATCENATRLLLVDDDDAILHAYGRTLMQAGFEVEIARSGCAALHLLAQRAFDVMVCDINMPQMSGLHVLRSVRQWYPELPVILMTGQGAIDTAIDAVAHGAFRYLLKPVDVHELRMAAIDAAHIGRVARLKGEAFARYRSELATQAKQEDLKMRFEWAMGSLWMAYQPIVSLAGCKIFAHEALVRNEEDSLRSPLQLFAAAEQLDMLDQLGRAIRGSIASIAPTLPKDLLLFVNVHPHDLVDDELFSANAPLSGIANRVVLEITESASIANISDLSERVALLRRMGYQIAIDDFGAGYASFGAFTTLRPEVVKIDMSLVREVPSDRIKQKLIGSMVEVCRELGILVVAEGVENAAERDALSSLGCDLLQGYYFGRAALTILGCVSRELYG